MYIQNNGPRIITYAKIIVLIREDLTDKGYDVEHMGTIELQKFISDLIPRKSRGWKLRFLDHFWLRSK